MYVRSIVIPGKAFGRKDSPERPARLYRTDPESTAGQRNWEIRRRKKKHRHMGAGVYHGKCDYLVLWTIAKYLSGSFLIAPEQPGQQTITDLPL